MDSSSLISLSSSCLIKVLEKLSMQKMNFFIPKKVEIESVETPLRIKRFEFNAVRIKKAIDSNWVKIAEESPFLENESKRIENLANNCFFVKNRPLTLIHGGEAESLALLKQLNSKVLIIDERTTRLLIEDPKNLKNHMQSRINVKISMDDSAVEKFRQNFKGLCFFRSSELLALAFEKNLLEEEMPNSSQALEAALYALKFNGCSISFDEVQDFLREK